MTMSVLRNLREALADGADGVFAERDGVELEFAVGIGGGGFCPIRRLALSVTVAS